MGKYEDIFTKYNFLKRLTSPSTTIEQIESFVKFKLPSDYKRYIQNYSGFEAQIGKEYVRLWDFDELIEMNNGYEITNYLPNTIGIGGNGSDEFIAIELINKDQYRILLSPFIDLGRENHIEIGTSFTDFLIRLNNGQEWFDKN